VDIDLSKFFDRINQDRMLERVKRKVHDNRIIRLIGLTLRSGVEVNGEVAGRKPAVCCSPCNLERTDEGTTQGSPLSPLLSNIVLDELDKELERRGFEFCRFADDCNIFFGSNKAAERAMLNITKFIEKKMKLVVNQEKSQVRLAKHVKFLAMTIVMGTIAISTQAMSKAMDKVAELTPRSTHKTIELSIQEINSWYRGWSNYFSMTQYPSQLKQIEAHIRRRLRARLIRNMKRKRTIVEKFIKRGVSKNSAFNMAYSSKSWWALSQTFAASKAFSNKWFESMGLFIRSHEQHSHWFPLDQWIKIL
jgi:RNA-directed DNA polymerase